MYPFILRNVFYNFLFFCFASQSHKKQEKIFCEKCNKYFHFTTTYNKHCRLMHDNFTLRFSCRICRVRFSSLKKKWNHSWEVHKVRNVHADCPYCSEKFRKFMDLKHHVNAEHLVHMPNENHSSVMKQIKEDIRRKRLKNEVDENASEEEE